jgi:hypothetical protein
LASVVTRLYHLESHNQNLRERGVQFFRQDHFAFEYLESQGAVHSSSDSPEVRVLASSSLGIVFAIDHPDALT